MGDEYREFYYKSFPRASVLPAGDLTQVRAIRSNLTCKSMDWFIENVFPTLFIPKPTIAEGLVQSVTSKLCLSTGGVEIASNPRQNPHVAPASALSCDPFSDHNQWYFMEKTNHLVHIGIWT